MYLEALPKSSPTLPGHTLVIPQHQGSAGARNGGNHISGYHTDDYF